MGVFAWMFATGVWMDGPLPPALVVAAVAALVSLAALRPSKALWLGFLYWVGGVEVSAQTLARLHWFTADPPDLRIRRRVLEAERRARRSPPRATADFARGGGLGPFLRELLFPRPRRR